MSRIGNNPVKLPPKVEVTLASGEISVKGPLGSLTRRFGDSVTIEREGDSLLFKAANEEADECRRRRRMLAEEISCRGLRRSQRRCRQYRCDCLSSHR